MFIYFYHMFVFFSFFFSDVSLAVSENVHQLIDWEKHIAVQDFQNRFEKEEEKKKNRNRIKNENNEMDSVWTENHSKDYLILM